MTKWDGAQYKKNASAQQKRALNVLEKITFDGNENVLDLGCGNGKITKIIADHVPGGEVVGIDISESMINQANQDFAKVPNLKFYQKSAENFNFEKKFNYVTSFNALHWVEDHNMILQNAKHSLINDGKIVFLMASGKRNQFVDEILQKDPWKSHFQELESFYSRMSKIDYEILLKNNDFTKDKIVIFDEHHFFSSFQELEQHFMTWLPAISDLPQEDCEKLAHQIAQNIASQKENSGKFVLTISMLLVLAHLDKGAVAFQ